MCVQGGTVYCTCKLERGSILCTEPCVFRGREQYIVPVSLRGVTSSVQDLVCSGAGYSVFVPVSLRGVPSSVQDLMCSEGENSALYL